MGQTTPNMALYIPSNGETLYGDSFAAGMLNIDQHDHSGPPNKGVPISATGIADGSVTAVKLNDDVVSPGGGLGFDANHAIQTEGLLNSLYNLATNGYLVQTSSGTANTRTFQATNNELTVTNGDGVSGNTTYGLATAFKNSVVANVNIQTFSASGTYTPTSGMIYCIIEVLGAGGGGGGAAATSAVGDGNGASAGGGGAGGYSRGRFTAAQIGASQVVTIGAGGAAATAGNNAGGDGGTTSVGALIQATGGGGAAGAGAQVAQGYPGGAGGVGSLGNLNIAGNSGGMGFTDNIAGSNLGISGAGGAGYFGGSISPQTVNNTGQSAGSSATSYGCGGNGGVSIKGGTSAAGGAGADGYVIITEYIHV